jgi:hypothetical protein
MDKELKDAFDDIKKQLAEIDRKVDMVNRRIDSESSNAALNLTHHHKMTLEKLEEIKDLIDGKDKDKKPT